MAADPRPAPAPRLLAALAALAVLGTACQELPKQRGRQVQVLVEGDLERLNPADVAVAPIEYAMEGVRAPESKLRAALQEALVLRRYSPLALEFVDSRTVEASSPNGPRYSPGLLGEEAVCQLLVHQWDERYWETGRTLVVDIELHMIDPARPEPPLWAARMEGQLDVTSERDRMTEALLYDYAIEEVARELTARLPARVAVPGQD